jgi:asparagine synthase (glutamine-hydrolysing)
MCGVNGIIKHHSTSSEIQEVLEKMNQKIIHRGPDDDGFFVEQNEDCTIGLAMRRLSIIDLSTGKQPQFAADNNLVIVFNGEIYNYQTLKKELEVQGVSFFTSSDTEVILKLYQHHGKQAFAKLDGMFGLAIYDKRSRQVIIARDFFGEKPLYYYHSEKELIWASELKSIISVLNFKPQIDKEALNLYFQLTYIPAPFTIYQGIKKLEANKLLVYDLEAKKTHIEAIDRASKKYKIDDFEQAKELTKNLVTASVRSRSIADVPLGTFLSGGVDSSIVSLLLAQNSSQKINTFSIGFDKKSFDETDKSRIVAQQIGSNHHEFIIGENDMKDSIDAILMNFDEPFADSSSLPTYLVAKKTADYVKVALTGDGGDEVFGGYNKYYMGKMNHLYTRFVPEFVHQSLSKIANPLLTTSDDKRGKRFKVKRLLNAINYQGDFYYNIISLAFQQQELSHLFQSDYQKADILQFYKNLIQNKASNLHEFREIDRYLSLEGDMLVKVDRTSMLASLECRAPFLNKALWDFTNSVPDAYLMKGWDKKYLLKKAFEDQFPTDFLNKSKQGFGVPVGDWLRGHLRPELERFIEADFLQKQEIFNVSFIHQIVQNHLSGKIDNTFRIWAFFCFQKWYLQNYA